MSGLAQTGPHCREPSASQQCTRHHRPRRRPRPILLLVVVFAFIRGVPRSRGWLLPVPQRGAGSPLRLKRLRAPSRTGGSPFRRRTCTTAQGIACRGLSLSAAPAVHDNLSTQLGNTAWPGQSAIEPASGFSLVHDEEAAVNSPSCESKLEGQGQQGFEGPEKTLEIEFDPDVGPENGLRAIRREHWDAILKQAQCHILHHRGNEWFDSYVLSESSLFVYKSKLVLKTCGTTALLRCLPILTDITKSYGLSLEWIGYSRKEFQFPTDQIYPHTSFTDEVDFLDTIFTGKAYVQGPLNSDHWYTYVADDGKRPTSTTADRTLNVMMYGLEPEVAQNFFKSEEIQTAEDASLRSGIRRVLPNATLQDHLFDPCGYSMNALEGRAYYTVHVTPESDFSYASFETNVRLPDYDELVRGVLEVFRPKKFTMTLFADNSGMENITQNPFDNCNTNCGRTSASGSKTARYQRTVKSTTNFSGDYLSQMGNWVRAPPEALQPAALEAA